MLMNQLICSNLLIILHLLWLKFSTWKIPENIQLNQIGRLICTVNYSIRTKNVKYALVFKKPSFDVTNDWFTFQ